MIAVDANILIYSHRPESRFHEASVNLIKGLIAASQTWAISWPCVYEFFSVVTNHRTRKGSAMPPSNAAAQIEFWTRAPNVALLFFQLFLQLKLRDPMAAQSSSKNGRYWTRTSDPCRVEAVL